MGGKISNCMIMRWRHDIMSPSNEQCLHHVVIFCLRCLIWTWENFDRLKLTISEPSEIRKSPLPPIGQKSPEPDTGYAPSGDVTTSRQPIRLPNIPIVLMMGKYTNVVSKTCVGITKPENWWKNTRLKYLNFNTSQGGHQSTICRIFTKV